MKCSLIDNKLKSYLCVDSYRESDNMSFYLYFDRARDTRYYVIREITALQNKICTVIHCINRETRILI